MNEKIDVYGLGNVIFTIMTGDSLPPSVSRAKDHPDREDRDDDGTTRTRPLSSFLPDALRSSSDPNVVALAKIMDQCHNYHPEERPSAFSVADVLDHVYKTATIARPTNE